ncbi:HalOD1 output domain-containing protein [Natrononativus amylolyticus]|uniref:HalOD1 output domain-containing protein n=1 Tax=Natrononativus amylolyticus TaxID=2963434 RepID=UPI0020CE00BF|nr:HalOD1 output domain-containing protein [Natrononativus amylolyticus]
MSEESSSTETPPSQAIIEAIAAHEGIDATDVEPPEYAPLYTAVNPEALDELFEPTQRSGDRVGGRVTLEYEGYEVVVHSDGSVELTDLSPSNGSVNSAAN